MTGHRRDPLGKMNVNALRVWLAGAVLVALTMVVFLPVLGFEYVDLDDNLTVKNNPEVLSGLSAKGLAWAFTTFHAFNWQPLAWISHMLDIQIFGAAPWGSHLVNLLFHGANSVLLLTLLARLTGAFWKSLLVAFLFAVHPLHVESVAWVSERKDVLSTFFWFLTMHAYTRYAAAPGLRAGVLVFLAFALGLMAKPMLVSAPFLLLLLDFWPLGRAPRPVSAGGAGWRGWRALVLEKMPLFALAAASAAVTIAAQIAGDALKPLQDYPLGVRGLNALNSYVAYLGKSLWPSGLHCFYPYTQITVLRGAAAGALILLVSSVAIHERRRRPYLPAGWFWYLGTLLPVIGLVQVGDQAMADRYTYVTLVGIFIILSWGWQDFVSRARRGMAVTAMFVPALVLALAIAGRIQTGYWKNNLTLFGRSLQVNKKNSTIHNNYGASLLDMGQTEEAISHFREAIANAPGYFDAHLNLGAALWKLKRKPEALGAFRQAALLRPTDQRAVFNLGMAQVSLGDFTGAMDSHARLVRIDPVRAKQLFDWISVARKARAVTGAGAHP